jgi:hypothetical protein
MGGRGKDFGQKLVAVIVILSMLALMGVPPTVIVFFAVVGYFVWRAVDRSEQHETRRVFEFYLAAHEILSGEDRRWFGFELHEVTEQGESVLHSMRDAPPLLRFALGALHRLAGDYDAAAGHLSAIVEGEHSDERHVGSPSPELRRYVSVLRALEREPSEGPLTIAAVRGLERLRTEKAAELLADARSHLASAGTPRMAREPLREAPPPQNPFDLGAARRPPAERPAQQPPQAPPPIADVLRDVYEEEKKTA